MEECIRLYKNACTNALDFILHFLMRMHQTLWRCMYKCIKLYFSRFHFYF